MCGEANVETLEGDQDTLPHLLALYKPKDIVIAVETVFCYKAVLARLFWLYFLTVYIPALGDVVQKVSMSSLFLIWNSAIWMQ